MDATERRVLGARIRQARREKGLTQRELADLLGITARSIQNYEAGRSVPYRHLTRIELITNKRAGWLVRDDDSGHGGATLTSLLAAMERHQAMLGAHVELLLQNTERLREQREALERGRHERARPA